MNALEKLNSNLKRNNDTNPVKYTFTFGGNRQFILAKRMAYAGTNPSEICHSPFAKAQG